MEDDKSDESNITKLVDKILKDIKNNGKTNKYVSVKSRVNTINLHPTIIKFLDLEKTMLKKDSGFDDAFNIFNEIYNKYNKLNKYKSGATNKINKKMQC